MKTTIKGIFACLLLACLITSCKKKEETVEMNDQTEVSTTASDSTVSAPVDAGMDTLANPESSSMSSSENMRDANNKPHNEGSSAKGTSSMSRNKSNASGKKASGYSAPDGTDAENNDGDQYTKNDKTRMPSGGSSIK